MIALALPIHTLKLLNPERTRKLGTFEFVKDHQIQRSRQGVARRDAVLVVLLLSSSSKVINMKEMRGGMSN